MPSTNTEVPNSAERIHKWMREFAPFIQESFTDLEQWDRDTLIRRYCVLRAHLRDTCVRVSDIPPPPPNADLAWWRQQVANPADAWILNLWTDPAALPSLLVETQHIKTVHTLIGLLIGWFFVCREYDLRLETQKISRAMRVMRDGEKPEASQQIAYESSPC